MVASQVGARKPWKRCTRSARYATRQRTLQSTIWFTVSMPSTPTSASWSSRSKWRRRPSRTLTTDPQRQMIRRTILDQPLKFIFSHSALREGWDNPNVFQICALRDIRTERERRQTIRNAIRSYSPPSPTEKRGRTGATEFMDALCQALFSPIVQPHKSPRLNVIASNGRTPTASSSCAGAIRSHCSPCNSPTATRAPGNRSCGCTDPAGARIHRALRAFG